MTEHGMRIHIHKRCEACDEDDRQLAAAMARERILADGVRHYMEVSREYLDHLVSDAAQGSARQAVCDTCLQILIEIVAAGDDSFPRPGQAMVTAIAHLPEHADKGVEVTQA